MSESRAQKLPPECENGVCELYCFNAERVFQLRRSLPPSSCFEQAEIFFSALGSRTRLLVLHCLCQAEELCVCDIANALRMNLSTVSHQLRYLRRLGLVKYRSQGRMAFYRLTEPRVKQFIGAVFTSTAASAAGEPGARQPDAGGEVLVSPVTGQQSGEAE